MSTGRQSESEMKKVLKIAGIILGLLLLAAAGFIVINLINTHKALNDPRLPDNYYEQIETGGSLEAKYVVSGGYDVDSVRVKSENRAMKNIYLFYPAEARSYGKTFPLVVVVNGSQTPAKTYLPYFERLASWGFIVAGNDDPQPGTGETSSEMLDYVLQESDVKEYVDTGKIGITGYSQGGAGAINAVTKFDNSSYYKALFTGSAAYPLLAMTQGWAYEPADIDVNYFMTASTGTSDDTGVADIYKEFGGVSPLQALEEIYDAMPDSPVKVLGRCKDAEHGDMQLRTDGYMTAWMLWQLQGDEEAARVFAGEDAEILQNPNWQDIRKNR